MTTGGKRDPCIKFTQEKLDPIMKEKMTGKGENKTDE